METHCVTWYEFMAFLKRIRRHLKNGKHVKLYGDRRICICIEQNKIIFVYLKIHN